MKFCYKCKKEKSEFAKGQLECKDCNKEYRVLNKNRLNEQNRRYYYLNKKKIDDKSKKYQEDNKSRLIEYRKEYRQKNKKHHNDWTKEYRKNRYHNDEVFRIKTIISVIISKSLNKNKIKTSDILMYYVGYSIQELREHIEKQFEPWMTWHNQGKYNPNTWNDLDQSTWTWQIDHIIPKSKLHYTSLYDDSFKKCWSLENLRPLSSKRNVMDGNRR